MSWCQLASLPSSCNTQSPGPECPEIVRASFIAQNLSQGWAVVLRALHQGILHPFMLKALFQGCSAVLRGRPEMLRALFWECSVGALQYSEPQISLALFRASLMLRTLLGGCSEPVPGCPVLLGHPCPQHIVPSWSRGFGDLLWLRSWEL